MTKILLCPDVRGWAFDVNLRAMERAIPEIEFRFSYLIEGPPAVSDVLWSDAVYLPYHAYDGFRDISRVRPVFSSLRSEFFDVQTRRPPSNDDVALVNACRGFHVVTKACYEQLRLVCPRVCYLTNPVETGPFEKMPIESCNKVAAWAGSCNHKTMTGDGDSKGFYSIILPACDRADWRLTYSEYHTNRRTPEEMPVFYSRASVYLCASEYEGASNSVMEALAAGRYVIATDCGNHRELLESGCVGMKLVPRTVGAFRAALEQVCDMVRVDFLEDCHKNRATIIEKWSWAAWRDRYKAFLEAI